MEEVKFTRRELYDLVCGVNRNFVQQENTSLKATAYDQGNTFNYTGKEQTGTVITGMQESGYTVIKILNPLPDSTLIVMNVVYYPCFPIMKKEETEHEH